jgi:hypothetical protein
VDVDGAVVVPGPVAVVPGAVAVDPSPVPVAAVVAPPADVVVVSSLLEPPHAARSPATATTPRAAPIRALPVTGVLQSEFGP